MAKEKFRTRLVRPEGVGTWTFAPIPARVVQKAGLRARMRVIGTADGSAFRSSLLPRGGGALFVVVPQALRDRIQKSQGQSVEIVLRADTRPVVLAVPPDFRRALGRAQPNFDGLAPSHRKAFLAWIADAKRPETRKRRITEAVAMVRRGDHRS